VVGGAAGADAATGRSDVSSSEVPGRHRRRAGASSDERPAASYREQAEPDGRKPRSGRRRRSSFWKELPLLIVVALLMTFLIQTFIAKVYVIPSGSMETTLHGCTGCNNDRVLVDKITYRFTDPAPGDVVVFRGPDSWSSEVEVQPPTNPLVRGLQQFGSLIGLAPPDEKDFVKRVIAVGGQTVQCCDSRDRVLVDGKPLNEPYIYYLPQAGPARQATFGPVTVPEGQLWMMGDSRNNSADSRAPDHGPVPVANVIGKARLIVLPLDRFGWIPQTDPQTTAVGMGATGAGTPLALGVLGAIPFALGRRRLRLRDAEWNEFLPPPRRKRSRRDAGP
jgi:signal peptidase I